MAAANSKNRSVNATKSPVIVGDDSITIPLTQSISASDKKIIKSVEPKYALTVISAFQNMLDTNPELKTQFVTVYNENDSTALTPDNANQVIKVATEAYKTASSGSDQSASFSLQRYVADIKMAFFHATPLGFPPLNTTDTNAFYTNFLMMLYCMTTETRGDYDKIRQVLSISSESKYADFDRINKKYILNTNFLILYVIHLRKLYQQFTDYVKNVIKPFIANLDVVMEAVKTFYKNVNKSTNNNKTQTTNVVRKNAKPGTVHFKLARNFSQIRTVDFLRDYIGVEGSNTFVNRFLSIDSPNFSQLFYVVYSVGMAINLIQTISPRIIKDIYKKVPELSTPLPMSDIFTRVLSIELSTPPTVFDALNFIYTKYDINRTKIKSFLTAATRLCDVVPRQIFNEINIKRLTNRDIDSLGQVYATFWFRYANLSRFMKEMVLRTARTITSSQECPTICAYYSKSQDYQLRIPGNDPTSILVYGYENNQQERAKLSRSLGAVGEAEIEPVLYMLVKNGELHYVNEHITYSPGDLRPLISSFGAKTRSGLSFVAANNEGRRVIKVSTKIIADYEDTKNATYEELNNENQFGGQSSATTSAPSTNAPSTNASLNALLKRYTKMEKGKEVAEVPLIMTPTNPTKSNNFKIYEGGLSGVPDIEIRRIYLGDRSNTTTRNKYKVNGWIVAVNKIDVAIIEYVKNRASSVNPNPDLIFNITNLSLENLPNLGVLLTPTIIIMAILIAINFFKTHLELASGKLTNELRQQLEGITTHIKKLGQLFSTSHDFQPDAKSSITRLINNAMFKPASRISCQ